MLELENMLKAHQEYEYKDILVDGDAIAFYLDSYRNFGWTLVEHDSYRSEQIARPQGKIKLKMQRELGLVNRVELTRLQRHFEDSLNQMDRLKHSRTAVASSVALTIGVFGILCITGAIFMMKQQLPIQMMLLRVMLILLGMISFVLPYFLYQKLVLKKRMEIDPLIQQKEKEIYEICEKGYKMIKK